MVKKNKKTVTPAIEHEEKNLFAGLCEDVQIVIKDGLPVSVILSMEDFDRLTSCVATAEELLEGKDLFMPDGQKVTFQEMVQQRMELEKIDYEADLASMFEEEFEEDESK